MSKRIYSPSILIDDEEYKCKARSVSLEPGDYINFCEPEWTFNAEIEIGYGADESWNTLEALEDTLVTVVLKPEDDTVAAGNPSATFSIRFPPIPFMMSDGRGNRQTMNLSVVTEAAPVFSTGA
jgi:hypothetical protein